MPYRLAYSDRYIPPTEENIGSLLDGCEPFVLLAQEEKNQLTLNVTGTEYTQLLSALIIGAKLMYLERWTYLYALMLEAAQCPAQLSEEGDCKAYPVYAPFVSWYPVNPFLRPEFVPDGFLQPPFTVYNGDGSFPPIYESGDVIIPISSISTSAFFNFGNAPRIELKVVGTGQIELDLLAIPAGGRLLVGVNDPPSFEDVIEGILKPSEVLIELNLDTSSVPPETDAVVEHEIDIEAGEGVVSTVYLTWIPALDLNEFPVQYGGGIRSVQLCGFEQEVMIMGVTDVQLVGNELRIVKDGNLEVVGNVLTSCSDVENCLQSSDIVSQLSTSIQGNSDAIDVLNSGINNLSESVGENALNIASISAENDQLLSDLNNVSTQVSQNSGDIETLQNSDGSGQGLLRVIHTETLDSPVPSFESVDLTGYRWWRATIICAPETGTSNYLLGAFNTDTTGSNYGSTITSNSRRLTQTVASGVGAIGRYTHVTVSMDGSCFDGIEKMATVQEELPFSTGEPRHQDRGFSWKSTDAIEDVKFSLENGNFAVGSTLMIVGVPCDASPVIPEPELLTASIDFEPESGEYSNYDVLESGNSFPDTIIAQEGLSGGWCAYASGSTTTVYARVRVYFDNPVNIKSIQFDHKWVNTKNNGTTWRLDVDTDDFTAIVDDISSDQGYNGIWETKIMNDINVPVASYVDFRVNCIDSESAPHDQKAFIDNIVIVYELQ